MSSSVRSSQDSSQIELLKELMDLQKDMVVMLLSMLEGGFAVLSTPEYTLKQDASVRRALVPSAHTWFWVLGTLVMKPITYLSACTHVI